MRSTGLLGGWPMSRDKTQARGLLLLFVLAAPFVLRAPERELPGVVWLQAGTALLLRPQLALQEVQARSQEDAPRVPAPLAGEADRRELRRELEASALRADVVDLFAAPELGRVPFFAEVRGVRARHRGARATLLDLALPFDPELGPRLAGAPVLVGKSLVGFVHAEPGPRQNLVVQTLADRPVRGQRRRVIALATSQANAALPELKLVVEGAGAADPHPMQAYLTTPRHFDTWSPGRFPFLAQSVQSRSGGALLPAGLWIGIVEDWGYLERDFVLTRFVRPDWDARSLVRVVLFVRPGEEEDLRQVDARATRRKAVPLQLAWQGPVGLGFRRAILHGPELELGAGVFAADRLVGIVKSRAGRVHVAESIGTRGQRLPVLARLAAMDAAGGDAAGRDAAGGDAATGRERILSLVVEGQGRGLRGARMRVVWPEEIGTRLAGAELFTGVRGTGLPPRWRIGRVGRQEGQSFELEQAGALSWPAETFGFVAAAPLGNSAGVGASGSAPKEEGR
jgi:hypothetical protein